MKHKKRPPKGDQSHRKPSKSKTQPRRLKDEEVAALLRLPRGTREKVAKYFNVVELKKGERKTLRVKSVEIPQPALFFNKFMLLPPPSQDDNVKEGFLRSFEMSDKTAQQYQQALLRRQEAQLHALHRASKPARQIDSLEAEVVSRMAVGHGNASVLETSLTLHPLYGFPYIPASAIKGLVRAHALMQLWQHKAGAGLHEFQFQKYGAGLASFNAAFMEGDLDAIRKGNNQVENIWPDFMEFHSIFGSKEQRGEVLFFDAYPVNRARMGVDIMNPHYKDYHTNQEPAPPADWQDPLPIFFLTVSPGTRFRFYWTAGKGALVKKVKAWLTDALPEIGVGAKRNAGYGEMKVTIGNPDCSLSLT